MKRLISGLLCLLLLAGLMTACGKTEETENTASVDTFSVGYAKEDISPKTSVPMGGFGDTRTSTMTVDPLYAICLAFSDKDTTVLVFTMDLLSANQSAFDGIRAYISEQTGIPVSHIMVTVSHTHSSPDLEKKVPAINDFIANMQEKMLKAAQDALADRKPAQMHTAFCRPEQMNYVRHYILDNGTYAGSNFGDFSSGKLIGHRGKADNLLQLIKFTREGGKDVVIVSWQAHYRMEKGTLISSDYYGVIRDTLEPELDCLAAFILGPSGNVNSRSLLTTERSILDYKEYGKTLSGYAIEAAKNFSPVQIGKLEIVENLYQGKSVSGVGTVEYALYALSLGDVSFIFAPYEMFDTNGITIRNNSKYHATILATCSNGRFYYIADSKAFEYNSYESGTSRLAQGSGELLAEEYVKMLDDLYTRTGITPTPKVADYNTLPFEPVSDGAEYTNLKPGDTSAYTTTQSGAYQITLRGPSGVNKMLVWDAEVRDQILSKSTVKLLFDDCNVIAGIAE